jgi:hypothetical protein
MLLSVLQRGFLAFVVGMISAAILQRIIGFFFVVIWVATLVGAIVFAFLSRRVFQQILDFQVKQVARISSLIAVVALQLFFLATIPLTVDRSYSVWLLARSEISESKDVSLAKLSVDTQAFFFGSGSELKKRMDEQVHLGNLNWNSDYKSVSLTKRGEFQVTINRWVANFFALNPKYSSGRN